MVDVQRRVLELVARSRRRGALVSALPATVNMTAPNLFYVTKVRLVCCTCCTLVYFPLKNCRIYASAEAL